MAEIRPELREWRLQATPDEDRESVLVGHAITAVDPSHFFDRCKALRLPLARVAEHDQCFDAAVARAPGQ